MDDAPTVPQVDRMPGLRRPVRIVFDASSDNRNGAYVALLLEPGGRKPRLIYGTAQGIPGSTVEFWALNRILKRVNTRYGGSHPLLVFTDCLAIVATRGTIHVQYRWLSRRERLMRHLDKAARALRRTLP
ncbi:hypothetical protein ACX4MT_18910 [Roseomonas mucosa]